MIRVFTLGELGANCCFLLDEKSGDALIVDPGGESKALAELISSKAKRLRYILLTHGHFDHIGGVAFFKRSFPEAEVCIHALDEACLSDNRQNLSAFGFYSELPEELSADRLVSDGDRLGFGEGFVEVIATPGHSRGSVCYLYGGVIFSGDTLFCGSVGRTDFPGGSFAELERSVRRLYALGDAEVYPGHGEKTTLEYEKRANAFVRG